MVQGSFRIFIAGGLCIFFFFFCDYFLYLGKGTSFKVYVGSALIPNKNARVFPYVFMMFSCNDVDVIF
jgi:hypothetical protein